MQQQQVFSHNNNNTSEQLSLLSSMYDKIAHVNGLVESLNEPKMFSNFISDILFDKENKDSSSSLSSMQRKMSFNSNNGMRTSESDHESSGRSNSSSSSIGSLSAANSPKSDSPPDVVPALSSSLSRSSSLSSLLNSAGSMFENHNSFGILGAANHNISLTSTFDLVDEVVTGMALTNSSNDVSLSSSFDNMSPFGTTGSSPLQQQQQQQSLFATLDSVIDTNRMTPVESENFWWNMNQLIQMYMQQEMLLTHQTAAVSSPISMFHGRPQQQQQQMMQRKIPNVPNTLSSSSSTTGGGNGRSMNNNFKMMMAVNQSPILPQPPALIKYAGGCSNKSQYPTMKPMQPQQQQQQQPMFVNNQNNNNNNRLFGRVITNNRGFVAQRAY